MLPPEDRPPTRWQALLFSAKAWIFRARRSAGNLHEAAPRRLRQELVIGSDIPPLAESRAPLYGSALPAEFALQAGKVQNLRVAARALHGRILPAGEVFSFWANVPRPNGRRGYAPGRELREGCVIPSVGGGLCQLSNALYDVALTAGCEIVERHAHSRRLPGSMAEVGRDATVFWNYVDLRFRAPTDCRLEVELSRSELIVRLRPTSGLPMTGRPTPLERGCGNAAPAAAELESAESCETCGVISCFRNPAAVGLPQGSTVAWLVDAWWPEHAAYVERERRSQDWLFTPLDSHRYRFGRYFWKTAGFARVCQARWLTLQRSIRSRRLAAQGAARQRALLQMDARLAESFARRLPYTALHVVVSQNLLPFLWRAGHLAGRTFDVLMTRLPMRELQQRLDAAAERWPASPTLADFRADASLVAAETAALAEARHWITPHGEIAAFARERAVKLDWHLPIAAARPRGKRIVFPASSLARKGAHEIRAVAEQSGYPISLVGPVLEHAEFWKDCDVSRAGEDWLADAAMVVLPAWVEHQPRRLLAAVAAGIPVIATEACGLAGVPGVTEIPTGDIPALVETIQRLSARGHPPVRPQPTRFAPTPNQVP